MIRLHHPTIRISLWLGDHGGEPDASVKRFIDVDDLLPLEKAREAIQWEMRQIEQAVLDGVYGWGRIETVERETGKEYPTIRTDGV